MRQASIQHHFLDWLLAEMKIKNDKQLGEFLGFNAPVMSKIRHGQKVTAEFILRVHERTDIPVKVIREKLTDQNNESNAL